MGADDKYMVKGRTKIHGKDSDAREISTNFSHPTVSGAQMDRAPKVAKVRGPPRLFQWVTVR